MQMTIYKNADDFLEENRSIMEQFSLEANLIWANATSHKTIEEGFFGVSIMQKDSIYLAIRALPHPMVHFSAGGDITEMAELLAKYLSGTDSMPENISGIQNTVNAFKEAAGKLCTKYTESRHLHLMKCVKANDIEVTEGDYQSPITTDFDFGPWLICFNNDCNVDETADSATRNAKRLAENGSLVCFAVDGTPVTMAAKKRKLNCGQCVGAVYTPDELRNKGYSTACIKHLTQEILDDGNDCAYLFVDKYNPSSSRVYEKVGYKKIADFIEYKMEG